VLESLDLVLWRIRLDVHLETDLLIPRTYVWIDRHEPNGIEITFDLNLELFEIDALGFRKRSSDDTLAGTQRCQRTFNWAHACVGAAHRRRFIHDHLETAGLAFDSKTPG
jgi:hypothetical protein